MPTMCKSLSRMVLVSCFLWLLPAVLLAQGETTSAIVGQVIDTTDAPIPGAVITISNRENGVARKVTTDQQGRFNFP